MCSWVIYTERFAFWISCGASRLVCGNSISQVPINYLRESIRRHVCVRGKIEKKTSTYNLLLWLQNWTFRWTTFTSNSNHLCGTTCEPLHCVNLFILLNGVADCCNCVHIPGLHYKLQCRICWRFIAAFFSVVARIQITLHIKHSISGKNEWTPKYHFKMISRAFRFNLT